MKQELTVRIIYDIQGIVQGVGFRPAVYRIAVDAGIGGWIRNESGSVKLALEGTPLKLGGFITSLHNNLPSVAKIDEINVLSKEEISPDEIEEFRIIESDSDVHRSKAVVIPADIAMCSSCEREILDPENRRYGYPFTTCTDCGPRYTVVNDMPYDRERTTLSFFPLCDLCRKEYSSPGDRRFHAESIACPQCGPKLELRNSETDLIEDNTEAVIKKARYHLAQGQIIALRGIGGYLLAVDANNPEAVQELRNRKNRPAKPFAVMFRDIETVFDYCQFNAEAVKLFHSIESPIVILPLKDRNESEWELISPDTYTVGAMVPYSPLHKLLFEPLKDDDVPPFKSLVMTSGNRGGEPICISNDEAFERLHGIADFFVCHDREVNLRNDDSICAIQLGKPQIWRRARGYAPQPIKLKVRGKSERRAGKRISNTEHSKSNNKNLNTILAMGGELKNTIAVGFDDEIILSPHIGDLENPVAVAGMENVVSCLPAFLNKKPDLIVVDLHPDMQSTRLGREISQKMDIPLLEVQHHHAHAAACMAENRLRKAIALVFDGTGLGTDGLIWGAECFYLGDEYSYKRIATFSPSSLPGGDSAVLNPNRQLISRLYEAGIEPDDSFWANRSISVKEADIWRAQIKKGINSPMCNSAGRLFDAVSVLLGIAPDKITYEGQAPISLEGIANLAKERNKTLLPFNELSKDGLFQIDWSPTISELYDSFLCKEFKTSNEKSDWIKSKLEEIAEAAYTFHKTVAQAAVLMVEKARSEHNVDDVVLSGGVFMNKILTTLVADELEKRKLNVFIHREIPPNDGGISFGQAIIGKFS